VENIILPILAFALIFPLFWCAVVLLVSRLSGWSTLSADYAAQAPQAGETFTWASGRIRFFSNYNHVLVVHVSERGIGLKTIWLFRVGHAPLFIPWEAIERVERSSYFFREIVRLSIRGKRGSSSTSVTLLGSGIADAIERARPR